jgi:plastocyanin
MSSLPWRSSKRTLLIVAPVLVLLSGVWLTSSAGAVAGRQRQAKTHTVTIEGTSFQPERLSVAVGDTVVWTNKEPFPHTASSSAGAFDSGHIAPDRSWTQKFGKRGEHRYICSLHPTMKGLVKVD